MAYWTYILQSQTSSSYYCGSTDSIARRLSQHNDPEYRGSLTTKRFAGPWQLVWKRKHQTRSAAMIQERAIKKRGIGRFLNQIY